MDISSKDQNARSRPLGGILPSYSKFFLFLLTTAKSWSYWEYKASRTISLSHIYRYHCNYFLKKFYPRVKLFYLLSFFVFLIFLSFSLFSLSLSFSFFLISSLFFFLPPAPFFLSSSSLLSFLLPSSRLFFLYSSSFLSFLFSSSFPDPSLMYCICPYSP